MTQDKNSQVIEGNARIAEFMGMNKDADDVWSDKTTGKIVILGEYRPHADWNELMPVVEKIEATETNEGNFEVFIFKRCCDIQTGKGDDHIIEITSAPSKINAVWEAVILFIQWYNKQKAL